MFRTSKKNKQDIWTCDNSSFNESSSSEAISELSKFFYTTYLSLQKPRISFKPLHGFTETCYNSIMTETSET